MNSASSYKRIETDCSSVYITRQPIVEKMNLFAEKCHPVKYLDSTLSCGKADSGDASGMAKSRRGFDANSQTAQKETYVFQFQLEDVGLNSSKE